jgi:hypothetical protein
MAADTKANRKKIDICAHRVYNSGKFSGAVT